MQIKIANTILSLFINLGMVDAVNAMEGNNTGETFPGLFAASPRTAEGEKQVLADLFIGFREVYTQEPKAFNAWAEIFYTHPDCLRFLNALHHRIQLASLDFDDKNTVINVAYLSKVRDDLEYTVFMQSILPEYPQNGSVVATSPLEYLQSASSSNQLNVRVKLNCPLKDINPAIGKYADPRFRWSPMWLDMFYQPILAENNPRLQGWKIHISAEPENATEIAKIAIAQFKAISEETGKNVLYKITMSLPHLRTLSLYKYIKGSESQDGKFITIYPIDQDQAYLIASKLDKAYLMEQSNSDRYTPLERHPLSGDAQVGFSGFIYARYGKFSPQYRGKYEEDVRTIEPLNTSRTYIAYCSDNNPGFVKDSRVVPWPDFMNTGNKEWETAENPFKDLPLAWLQNGKEITWDSRPSSWANLKLKDH